VERLGIDRRHLPSLLRHAEGPNVIDTIAIGPMTAAGASRLIGLLIGLFKIQNAPGTLHGIKACGVNNVGEPA
jgi:hypothetical protein